MIMTQPNDFIAEVHDRHAGATVKPDQFEHWLSGAMESDQLKPFKMIICNDDPSPSVSTVQRPRATTPHSSML
jgi:putative SOS response-associated peptidase YedK